MEVERSAGNIKFTKMHGLGNDYLYINAFEYTYLLDDSFQLKEWPKYVRSLSDRNFGVGGDGVILICPPLLNANFWMRMYNADGSEGEMCGNGIRCAVKFALDHSIAVGDPKYLKV